MAIGKLLSLGEILQYLRTKKEEGQACAVKGTLIAMKIDSVFSTIIAMLKIALSRTAISAV